MSRYERENRGEPRAPGEGGDAALWKRAAMAMGISLLFFLSYGLANRFIPVGTCHDLSMPLDGLVPFWPGSIYIFYLAYGLMPLSVLLVEDEKALWQCGLSFSLLFLASFCLFWLLPVHVPRPEIVPESFSGRLVSAVYSNDRPVCGFPSLHVSASFLAAFIVWRKRPSLGTLFFVLAGLTSVSTLFVKQHVLLDLAGGVLLAVVVDRAVMGGALERTIKSLRAAKVLAQSQVAMYPGKKCPGVKKTTGLEMDGVGFDLYEPKGRIRGSLMAIHGLTINGEKDPRLIRFCAALAGSGMRTAAVCLPGLKACRFESGDVEAINRLARAMTGKWGALPGVVGFSFGAGYALCGAAREPGLFGPIVAFGAYGDLGEVLSHIKELGKAGPEKEEEWDAFIYARAVMAYVDTGRKDGNLEAFLSGYCQEESLERKKDFFLQTLADREVLGEGLLDVRPEMVRELSPKGRSGQMVSDVFFLHDSHDQVIPPSQSQSLHEEILAANRVRSRLVVTPLLSHVGKGKGWHVRDFFRLLACLGEIYP